jgi:hypothetical protein
MEEWLLKAQKLFPELQSWIFEPQDNPMSLWIDLWYLLTRAYQEDPINEDLIGRIYGYAAWCFQQPDTGRAENSLSGATAVGFIENIPLESNVSADLPRWMSAETFEDLEGVFRYMLDDEQYRIFREDFLIRKQRFPGPTLL